MMNNKPIWVDEKIHCSIKARASKQGKTIKKLMEETFGKDDEEIKINARFKMF